MYIILWVSILPDLYRSISVVLIVAVVMIFMAAHHEKESDDLALLNETKFG